MKPNSPNAKRKMVERKCWQSMKRRCLNPKAPYFVDYGGRGITICAEWVNDFDRFYGDMGPRPDGHSLDRFPDNDGNYEPGNCRWATPVQQNNNRRVTVRLVFDGRVKSIMDWADEVGVAHKTLYARLRSGWTVREILSHPARSWGR